MKEGVCMKNVRCKDHPELPLVNTDYCIVFFSQTNLCNYAFYLLANTKIDLLSFIYTILHVCFCLSTLVAYFEIKQMFHLKFPSLILDDNLPPLCYFPLSKEFLEDGRVRAVEERGCLHTNELLKAVLKLAPPDNLASLTRGIKMLQTEDASRQRQDCAFQHKHTKLKRIDK